MNKKGFMKILEAIIAIIIVFTVVLMILPKTQRNVGAIPSELELISSTIIEDAQNDESFRKCMLGFNDYPKCIRDKVDEILGGGTVWGHAERICKVVPGPSAPVEQECKYLCKECTNNDDELIFENSLPKDRDIYTKEVSLSVPDVTAKPPQPQTLVGVTKQLRLYFWSK